MGSVMHHPVKPPHKLVLWWEPPFTSTPSTSTCHRVLGLSRPGRGQQQEEKLSLHRGLGALPPDLYLENVSMDQGVRSVVLPGNTIFF